MDKVFSNGVHILFKESKHEKDIYIGYVIVNRKRKRLVGRYIRYGRNAVNEIMYGEKANNYVSKDYVYIKLEPDFIL